MFTSGQIIILVAVLLPFVAAAFAPLLHRLIGSRAGLLLALVPLAAFVLLLGPLETVMQGNRLLVAFGWAPSWGLELGFLIDGLSLTFALAISGIGALVVLYASSYLKGYAHQGRFMMFLMGFMGAMQGLVLADNLVALYLFWELTSVASFLLIGYDHMRQAARRAAIQALVVTGAGGLALLAAGIGIRMASGSWALSDAGLLTAHVAYPVLVLLVLLAAFTKSAQVPFHFWLPNAMEAPTPVSAYLHSATMVQGGVYLVARMTPNLGGEAIWNVTLIVFGAVTLIWGALAAIRQTDLKQMLAQTTLASLGLLILLLGVGTELAVTAALLYFIAHALYKAGLFMVAGAIDHGTGTREITALGGLRDKMSITFIGTIMTAGAMIGVPPLLAFFAKEEMYLALASFDAVSIAVLAVLVLGNALMGAVGLAILIRPFMGPAVMTPIAPHEAKAPMLVGPLLLGVLGVALGFVPPLVGEWLVAPGTSAVLGISAYSHLKFAVDLLGAPFLLSVLTWVLAGLIYWKLDALRMLLRQLAEGVGWTFDKGFDQFYFGLVSLSGRVTRGLHHGEMDGYTRLVFIFVGIAALGPMLWLGGMPELRFELDLNFYEWGTVLLAVTGVAAVLLARSRLLAILALGVQGIAVAMLFLLFGGPDLSFTQFMVEILSVVILAMVMTRLELDAADARPFGDWLRDISVALFAGFGLTALLFRVLQTPMDTTLSTFFDAYSAPVAYGYNIVNVILVDFRAIDTLGEIAVVMTAGIAIVALIRGARRTVPPPPAKGPADESGSAAAATPAKPRARRTRKAATA